MADGRMFYVGVEAVFRLGSGNDCVVAGALEGTVRVGDVVTVWDPGNDCGSVFQSEVLGIEVGYRKTAQEATDRNVALTLRDAGALGIRVGSVVSDPDAAQSQIRGGYMLALMNAYVVPRGKGATESPELTDDILERMTIADLAFTWWAFGVHHTTQSENREQALQALSSPWSHRCLGALAEKILAADKIYCVFSKRTGCPYLFSETSRLEDGNYECSRPAIRIYPEAERAFAEQMLDSEQCELRCIERGETGTGIRNFLGSSFWQDGACAVQVVASETVLPADQLVSPPEERVSDDPGRMVPVANPQLVRWMLLMGQMGKPETGAEKISYQLYWNLFCKELPGARLLQPVQKDPSGNGAFDESLKLTFALSEGKDGRQAAYLYTDWKRFRTKWGAGWEGLVQSASDVIHLFDLAINVTDHHDEGCYVSDRAFEEFCK